MSLSQIHASSGRCNTLSSHVERNINTFLCSYLNVLYLIRVVDQSSLRAPTQIVWTTRMIITPLFSTVSSKIYIINLISYTYTVGSKSLRSWKILSWEPRNNQKVWVWASNKFQTQGFWRGSACYNINCETLDRNWISWIQRQTQSDHTIRINQALLCWACITWGIKREFCVKFDYQ